MTSQQTTLISNPASSLSGSITVPGDKSIAHRAIILASLAEGTSTLTHALPNDDCLTTLRVMGDLGVTFDISNPEHLTIHGVGKYGLHAPKQALDCGNAGTLMRLLAGVLAAQRFDTQLTGDSSLLSRPMARITKPLQMMGARVQSQDGKPPLSIQGGALLKGIQYTLPIASAQVKSCLLLAGLYADGETSITSPLPTRDHTEKLLTAFGGRLEQTNDIITVSPVSALTAHDIHIPGDISSAAFFLVAASVLPKSRLEIKRVGLNPTRCGMLSVLKKMGADITVSNTGYLGEEPIGDITVQHSLLKGVSIPATLVPFSIDEYPILFIAAACAKGVSIFHGLGELRHKESNRLVGMVQGLQSLGVEASMYGDSVRIEGSKLNAGVVDSLGDHRIAMAFAVAGAVSKGPVHILNADMIRTSFPTFVSTAQGIQWPIQENVYHG